MGIKQITIHFLKYIIQSLTKVVQKKLPNIGNIGKTLLNNPWVKEEISRDIRQHFKLNNNRNSQSNFGDRAKLVLRGKFTILKKGI